MTGGNAMVSMTDLYAYIGALKGQLDGLIDAVVAKDAAPAPKRKHKFF